MVEGADGQWCIRKTFLEVDGSDDEKESGKQQFSNSELEITTSMFPVSNDVQREKKCQVRLEPHLRD